MPLNIDGTTGIVYDNLASDVRNLFLPKNWVINGMFDVWQRGISQTSSGYGSDDRWTNEHANSTKTNSRQSFAEGQTDVPNNPTYFNRTVVSSVAGAGNFVVKAQKLEDVRKLAGKTITISFWAKADSNKNLAIDFTQVFGGGGSVGVSGIGTQKFALTSSWQKFTKTVTLPSISGKTVGTDSYTGLRIWFDAGSSFNAQTDSLGHQSGTFDIANISLVEGSVAVECQNQPYADVLRDCQRYYQRLVANIPYSLFGNGFALATTGVGLWYHLPVVMRKVPTLGFSGPFGLYEAGVGVVSASNMTLSANSTDSVVDFNIGASGLTTLRTYQLVSNGVAGGYIEFIAEL